MLNLKPVKQGILLNIHIGHFPFWFAAAVVSLHVSPLVSQERLCQVHESYSLPDAIRCHRSLLTAA